jgi:hypothetical protein
MCTVLRFKKIELEPVGCGILNIKRRKGRKIKDKSKMTSISRRLRKKRGESNETEEVQEIMKVREMRKMREVRKAKEIQKVEEIEEIQEIRHQDATLLFNGGFLGEHNFHDVIYYWHPISMSFADPKGLWFEAILLFEGLQYPIWMRKVLKEKLNEIVFIDELKGLYGVEKIGTHTACLYGYPQQNSDGLWVDTQTKGHFICFKIAVGITSEGRYDFNDPQPLISLDDDDEKTQDVIRRHLIFFELVGIHYNCAKQFVWMHCDNGNKRLIAINLSLADFTKNIKLPSNTSTSYFFTRVWHKQELIESMLNFNCETYEEFYERFEIVLEKLIRRYYPQRLSALPWLKLQIDKRMLIYYHSSREIRVFIPDPTIDIMFRKSNAYLPSILC